MATGGASSGDEDSSSEFSDLDDDAYLFTTDDTEYDWMMAQQLQELGDALPDIGTASGTSGSKFDTNPKGAKNEKAKVLEDESSSVTETETPKKLIQRVPKIKSTLHSKKLTAEILAKTHKVEMVTAQAAVQSQGCDLELCLQWIERNQFNSSLFNEKSMEFRWSCDLVTELEMMKWSVKTLVTSYGVAQDLAMAVTHIKGCQNFKICKNFAMTCDLSASDVDEAVAAYKQRIELLRNSATTEPQTKNSIENWRDNISGFGLIQILQKLGIESPLLDNICEFHNLAGWKAWFEWALRNQYDDGKLDFDTFFNPDEDLDWWFYNKEEVGVRQPEKGPQKISSLNTFFTEAYQCDKCVSDDTKQIRAISVKSAVAKLLSDFIPSHVAKAAVEAYSIRRFADRPDLWEDFSTPRGYYTVVGIYKCKKWADEHFQDEHMIQRLSSAFDTMPQGQRLDEFIASTCRRILTQKRKTNVQFLSWKWRQIYPTFKKSYQADINTGRRMLSRCHSGFLEKSLLKVRKAQTVGVEGGKITLEECSISFPEGALTGDTDFEMTLDNNPDSFPDLCIPVTPIIGCRPHIPFLRPVTVEMTTCYSAIDDAKISASLYQRREATTDWGEIKEVMIGSKNVVQFDVMHFSDDIVGVSEDNGGQGEFHLINDVYIKKDTGTVSSMFFVDQGAHAAATTAMKQRGVYPLLMAPKEIIAKMNTEMKLTMQCRKPQGTTVVNCTDPPNVKITPQFLKKRGHQLYFELEPELGNFNGTLSIQYEIKIDEESEGMLPLTTNWPIVADPPAPVVNVDARTSMRANVITTGNATTSIENHDPVTTMDTD